MPQSISLRPSLIVEDVIQVSPKKDKLLLACREKYERSYVKVCSLKSRKYCVNVTNTDYFNSKLNLKDDSIWFLARFYHILF